MWVASYGVMPQAYSVATGPATAAASSPLAVSVIFVTGPRPGRSGTLGPRQESIKISATGLPPSGGSGVSAPAGVPRRPGRTGLGSERLLPPEQSQRSGYRCAVRPRSRRPAGRPGDDPCLRHKINGLLERERQREQPGLAPGRPHERHPDRQADRATGRNGDRRVAAHRGGAGRGEARVVAEHVIGQPGGTAGQRDDRVKAGAPLPPPGGTLLSWGRPRPPCPEAPAKRPPHRPRRPPPPPPPGPR